MSELLADHLRDIYDRLCAAYGPQRWWPGESPFEVVVGAILSQSAAWANAAKAIANLKAADALSTQGLLRLPLDELARLVRPSGYYNAKARKLKAFAEMLVQGHGGDMSALFALPLPELRRQLLATHGIGQETADSIALYAAHKPTFVIDAYTCRVFSRLGIQPAQDDYASWQALFMETLPSDVALFNEYHALIDQHAKTTCRKAPLCDRCCLREVCSWLSTGKMGAMIDRGARVDDLGRAYAGSQLQIQIYVNRRPGELSQCVLDALPALSSLDARLRWVSPLESEQFVEYQDKAFLRALGVEHLDGYLKKFWPRRGPTWDALAIAEVAGHPERWGIMLVEAKSHPPEMYSSGCQALMRSRKKIEAALEQTKHWLGVPEDSDWTGPLYQSANRLAHLYFFREIVRVPAWLVNVYSVGDPHSPTTHEEWEVALAVVKAELGLAGITLPYTAEVFLEARDRGELFGLPGAEASGS